MDEKKTLQKIHKYIVFSPYFGRLPVGFNLWLESCSYNKNFSFVVFTDNDVDEEIPDNVEIVRMSFDEFREKIQKKFKFKVSLNEPYKLCDFKPTYGYVFSDYIKGYDYWGYCDLDLIFGDIEKFMPDEKYDKISYHGHFCLYKNLANIREMFMENSNNTIGYIDILSHGQSFAFDEIGDYGINKIFQDRGLSIYDFRKFVADVNCRRKGMYCRGRVLSENGKGRRFFGKNDKEKIFVFDNGKVYSYNVKGKKFDDEYAYVHFQKRKMVNKVRNRDRFLITYDSFVDYPFDETEFRKYSPKNWIDFRWIKVRMHTIPRRLNRDFAVMRLKQKKGRSM